MYTKEQLQAMSDFEVNMALAELLGFRMIRLFNSLQPSLIYMETEAGESICCDYCKDPSDIMPLAFEHGIGLTQPMLTHQSKWQANWFADGRNYGVPDHYISETNPLRAIACCLILVLQER